LVINAYFTRWTGLPHTPGKHQRTPRDR
jgi:hypothetical protein